MTSVSAGYLYTMFESHAFADVKSSIQGTQIFLSNGACASKRPLLSAGELLAAHATDQNLTVNQHRTVQSSFFDCEIIEKAQC